MSERQLNDQRARDTIATDLDTNLMVLAGAGSGKTHVLVERMVACIASGPTEVENLAAITFTRKAAGEMRGRFTLRLRDAVDGARGDEAARLRHAVDRVDGCFIGTIHAFCARLLRERPVEAGVPPEFVEVEEREEIPLRRQAWDRFIQHRYADGDRLLLELEEIDIRPEDLYAAFSERCRFGELVLKPSPPIFLDLAGPVSEVLAFIERGEAQIPDPLPGRRDTFMAALGRARDFISHRGLDTDRERVALLDLLDSSAGITLKGWHPNEAFARDLRDNVWPHFRETVIRPAITQVRQHICHSAGGLLDEAMRFYEGLRLEWGRLTFHDLLMRAAALLRDHSHVRRYFQQRYRCLFVDEFQDTDPIQAEVLLYLTGSDLREPDWRRLEPVPGSLFIVGDEKQSIYRFRRADVQTLHLVRDRLLQSGGRTVELTTSFRSLGNLCRWTNDTFAPLFAQSSPPHQAEFSPLLHHRPVGPDPCGVRRISNPKVPGNRRHDIAAHDAERIVDFIAAAITGQTGFNGSSPDAILQDRASPGDFMILTRTTGGLHHYARALEERRIPFDIVGGGRLGESDELRALVEMVEAVYAPDNPIPLLGYLRGPLVGLGDDELYALRRTGGSFNHRTALPDGLPDPLRDRLDAAYSRLRRAARWLRTVAPATAFEHILDDLGLLPFSLARHNGSSKAGNLVRVLSLVRHWECGGMHWGQIVAELRDLIDDGDYRIEEMTLEAGQEDVVRLMNLHQAKGLQARVVFLADPYDTAAERHDVAFHVSRTTEPPCLSMPIRKPRGPYARRIVAEPAGWAEDAEKEGRFGQAEERRLLYVAATRAENLLVVSTYEGNRNRGPWVDLYGALAEVPELSVCSRPSPPEPGGPLPDWARQAAEREERWSAVREPTYALRSVTGEDPTTLIRGPVRGESRGVDYGLAAHRLFEAAARGGLPADPGAYVLRLLREADLEEGLAGEVTAALDALTSSSLWQQLQESEAVYTEVPLARPARSGDRPGVLRGVIDLIYRTPEGWKIVDYKTDAVPSDDVARAVVDRYSRQVQAYADHWETVTGEPVTEKGIWLTAVGRFRSV